MFVDQMIENATHRLNGRKIKDVRAGLGYTCVTLADNSCGLAYTFRNELGPCCGTLDEAGTLIGKSGEQIISFAKSNNLLEAAIGLATINAVFNITNINWEAGNIVHVLGIDDSVTFGMVGDFHPILSEIKKKTKNIYVFEKNVPEGSSLYREDDIPKYLPQCNVIVITATSIINHTLDQILQHCQNARQVCIVGPSTPLCPELFKDSPVTTLAGSVVTNPDLAMQIISQGGGTMSLKPAIQHVMVKV